MQSEPWSVVETAASRRGRKDRGVTKQQQHIVDLVRDGWALYKRASRLRAGGGTAWLERGTGQAREVRHTTAFMVVTLLKAGAIAPVVYIESTGTTVYDLAERVTAPHRVL